MTNIGFIESLIKKYQPELLGGLPPIGGTAPAPSLPRIGQPVPYVGDAPAVPLTTNNAIPTIDQLQPHPVPDAPMLPAIAPTAAVTPVLPAIAATDPNTPIDVPAIPAISPQLAQSEQQLSDLVNKDYSKGQYRRPDGSLTSHPMTNGVPNEVVTAPGKDRAKKWSTASKILNGLEGWLLGGAVEGVRGATDRNYQAKLRDDRDIASLLPKITAQQQIAARDAATAGAYERPAIAKAELQRKAALDTAREKYWNRKADQNDLKQATNDDLIQMRDKWMVSKDQNDKRRLDIVEKELGERQRHNQVSEKQAVTNEQGRNTRAATTQTGMNKRQQITIAAQKEAAAVRAAEAKGNQAEAQAARERLAKLKQQYDLEGTQ